VTTAFTYHPTSFRLTRLLTRSPGGTLQNLSYGYDEAGNLITQKDANGHITRYEYDGLGREKAEEKPLGERSTKSYDATGRLTQSIDFLGRPTTRTYDALGRLATGSLAATAVLVPAEP
jgi:YD repeat-containing protein